MAKKVAPRRPSTPRGARPVRSVPLPAPLTTKDGETGHVQILGRPVSLSLAHRDTGLSLSHLSRVFGGHRTPSTRVLVKLARYLQVTTDALLTELSRIQAERNIKGTRPHLLVFDDVQEEEAEKVASLGVVG